MSVIVVQKTDDVEDNKRQHHQQPTNVAVENTTEMPKTKQKIDSDDDSPPVRAERSTRGDLDGRRRSVQILRAVELWSRWAPTIAAGSSGPAPGLDSETRREAAGWEENAPSARGE